MTLAEVWPARLSPISTFFSSEAVGSRQKNLQKLVLKNEHVEPACWRAGVNCALGPQCTRTLKHFCGRGRGTLTGSPLSFLLVAWESLMITSHTALYFFIAIQIRVNPYEQENKSA
jgi:hypothetical protein